MFASLEFALRLYLVLDLNTEGNAEEEPVSNRAWSEVCVVNAYK